VNAPEKAFIDEFVSLRRQIHSAPELAFEEHETARLVAEKLASWGYTVTTGVGGTGVVGQLRRGNAKPCLGLRADMDALPIQEGTQLPWASVKPGLMHACGHDGHTAMLLAAAKRLAQDCNFDGTLNLIFQPAEEGGGGALKMMADGLFTRFPCDMIFAAHNMPGMTTGQLVFRNGPAMASSDYATVTLTGRGGHGAMPHLANDPVVAAASIVMALQTVVSRNVDPLHPAVVTVGAVNAGHANNVIPAVAKLEISVRALNPEARTLLESKVKSIIHGQAQSYGLTADIDWRQGYAVLVNDSTATQFAIATAQAMAPAAGVNPNGPMLMGSEDFAFMLQQVPGCYFLIGNGTGDGHGACMVHNPGYDFNDDIIAVGADFWTTLALAFFSTTPKRETS
jgi:hippurate hydrolase